MSGLYCFAFWAILAAVLPELARAEKPSISGSCFSTHLAVCSME